MSLNWVADRRFCSLNAALAEHIPSSACRHRSLRLEPVHDERDLGDLGMCSVKGMEGRWRWTHVLEKHLYFLVRVLDDHVNHHLPYRHGRLDAAGDDVKAASEAEKVERPADVLMDCVGAQNPHATIVVLLQVPRLLCCVHEEREGVHLLQPRLLCTRSSGTAL